MDDWFVSKFIPDDLPQNIDTGFRVGRDNWQFINYGSYVTPGGQCVGMSLTAMWYYTEQSARTRSAYLNGQFDYPHGAATPGYQWDDAHAYRWAAAAQVGMGQYISPKPFRWLRDQGLDRWQFQVFRYAMLVTGEPQLVTLSSNGGGAHAIIAFRADVGAITLPDGQQHPGGTLYVSDPNEPTSAGAILFDASTDSFVPFQSGLRADSTPLSFEHIGFAAKTAYIDWVALTATYAAMMDGSIGSSGVGASGTAFPTLRTLQWLRDPATGVAAWSTVTDVAVAAGDTVATPDFLVTPGVPGQRVKVEVLSDGATTPAATAVAERYYMTAKASMRRDVALAPGVYKLVIWAQLFDALKGPWDYYWVDAVPFAVGAAPAVTTTVPTSTVVPTLPITTLPPTTVPPPTAPPATYDCSACPPGLAGLDCRLHCEGI